MTKRKRNELDLSTKIKLIEDMEAGMKMSETRKKYGVGKTTIYDIMKAKDKYRSMREISKGTKFRVVKTKFSDIDQLMLVWFRCARDKHIPINGPIMRSKAEKFAEELRIADFKASEGWLTKWKRRHEIKQMVVNVDQEGVLQSKEKMTELCDGYESKDIFNCDETGLLFRALPNRTLSEKQGDVGGVEISKERITVMFTCSMTGEKLKPMIIGQAENPSCFETIKKDSLPVLWKANRKAWMTGALFDEYLTDLNNQMRDHGRNILLFLDHAASHVGLEKSNVRLAFLPANTTSVLQPLEQGIIKAFKSCYRAKLLRSVLAKVDDVQSASEISKQITVLDAVNWIAAAWRETTDTTIIKCFNRCGFSSLDSQVNIDDSDIMGDDIRELVREIDTNIDAETYVDFDNQIPIEEIGNKWEDELVSVYNGSKDVVPEEIVREEPEADENVQDCHNLSYNDMLSMLGKIVKEEPVDEEEDIDDGRNLSFNDMLSMLGKIRNGVYSKAHNVEIIDQQLQELMESIKQEILIKR